MLRDIVRSVEQNSDLDPDHPDLLALKRILLEKISPAETGDSLGPENTTRADLSAALPAEVSLGNALGVSATGDPLVLPKDPVVSQALGLGTSIDQRGLPAETGDSQPSNQSAAADPSLPPPIEGA
ncbi:hypothetical protein [Occallatibacter riparius]|uniref:Uncharacterized protein n=1 Tax=Occallatibacter riparius TaxID=1002689 RepID=A0A9J7BTV8_9BACT|nr:hypothetical protein [Occallatibacter riparius]UWZ84358.1 hypothetical protein MOP44_00135 [Occallatibacter riparius]